MTKNAFDEFAALYSHPMRSSATESCFVYKLIVFVYTYAWCRVISFKIQQQWLTFDRCFESNKVLFRSILDNILFIEVKHLQILHEAVCVRKYIYFCFVRNWHFKWVWTHKTIQFMWQPRKYCLYLFIFIVCINDRSWQNVLEVWRAIICVGTSWNWVLKFSFQIKRLNHLARIVSLEWPRYRLR